MAELPGLVQKLIERQDAEALSDSAFAASLGISQPMWSLIRKGQRPIGKRSMRCILRRFPSLGDDVLNYLRAG